MDGLDVSRSRFQLDRLFYIAFRARRARWLLWGLVYFAIFVAFAVTTEPQVAEYVTGLTIVAGIVSLRDPHFRAPRSLSRATREAVVRCLRRRSKVAANFRSGVRAVGCGSAPVVTMQQRAPSGSSGPASAEAAKAPPESPPEAPSGPTLEALEGLPTSRPKRQPRSLRRVRRQHRPQC